jgi:hypothetical protein
MYCVKRFERIGTRVWWGRMGAIEVFTGTVAQWANLGELLLGIGRDGVVHDFRDLQCAAAASAGIARVELTADTMPTLRLVGPRITRQTTVARGCRAIRAVANSTVNFDGQDHPVMQSLVTDGNGHRVGASPFQDTAEGVGFVWGMRCVETPTGKAARRLKFA